MSHTLNDNVVPTSFLEDATIKTPKLHTRASRCERQLDNRGKRGNHHCSYDFRGESIIEAKGSVFLDLYPF